MLVCSRFKDGAGAGRRREWLLKDRKLSHPLQTKIRAAGAGHFQVVGGRDFRTAKCDQGISAATSALVRRMKMRVDWPNYAGC